MEKKYHGWIVLHDPAPGYNPQVTVEYINAGGRRDSKSMGYGDRGTVEAIEWWDKKLGQPAKLEPTIRGCYRVYTEEKP